ncbi:MAG: hypothetical protein PHY90_06885 [Desulfitobacteriaceae bacterium]|jgi:hypothetical protein|nr:hypothetical protein [Desulfitobacteriaceae bacterium]
MSNFQNLTPINGFDFNDLNNARIAKTQIVLDMGYTLMNSLY